MDCYSLQQPKQKRKQKHRKTLGEETLTSRVTTSQPAGARLSTTKVYRHTNKQKNKALSVGKDKLTETTPAEDLTEKRFKTSVLNTFRAQGKQGIKGNQENSI